MITHHIIVENYYQLIHENNGCFLISIIYRIHYNSKLYHGGLAVARLSAAESFRQVTWPPPKSDARVGGYDFLGGEIEAGGRPRSEDWRSRVTEESEL